MSSAFTLSICAENTANPKCFSHPFPHQSPHSRHYLHNRSPVSTVPLTQNWIPLKSGGTERLCSVEMSLCYAVLGLSYCTLHHNLHSAVAPRSCFAGRSKRQPSRHVGVFSMNQLLEKSGFRIFFPTAPWTALEFVTACRILYLQDQQASYATAELLTVI